MTENEFIKYIKDLGITCNDDKLNKLNKYYEMIVEYNKVMNLTGITDKKQVYLKHFYDSLTIAKSINLNEYNTLCDIGTGAGFPGLVIKIFYPHLSVTLVDSLNKRINFLNDVIKELELKNQASSSYNLDYKFDKDGDGFDEDLKYCRANLC